MGLTNDGQNAAATGVGDAYRWLAIFNGDPEGAGSEIAGGAYARKQVTWNASSGGQRTATGSPVAAIDIPAGGNCTHWALFSASTGGTMGYAGALPSTENFGSAGVLNVDSLTLDPLAT